MECKNKWLFTALLLLTYSATHSFQGDDSLVGMETGITVETMASSPARQSSDNDERTANDNVSDRMGELQSKITNLKEERRADKKIIKNLQRENKKLRRQVERKRRRSTSDENASSEE